jgi:hypothetical protein
MISLSERGEAAMDIYIKEIGPGQWLAATGTAPYFCFEADSRERVREIALRALRFYDNAKGRLEIQVRAIREREKAIPTFSQKDKVSARELEAA